MSEKTVIVMRKKWVIKDVPPNTEIGSDETTYKVVSGPIEIAGYWFSVKVTKRNIRRQYRQHMKREGP